MNGFNRALAVTALVWTAAVMQAGLGGRLAVFGITPDLNLAVLAPIALTGTLAGSTGVGFLSGWLQGALAGANLGQYVLSRTLGVFLLALVRMADLQIGPALAAGLTVAFTLVVRLIFLFVAPPLSIGEYLGDTIGTAMYNGVIATPIYMALMRLARRSS